MKTAINFCGVTLRNPIVAASGTAGFGREIEDLIGLPSLGGISLKALTPKMRAGNPPPRVAETPSGMLNAVGLQNPGINAFERAEWPWVREQDTAKIMNIAGSAEEDYIQMAQRAAALGPDIIEMNISCPNVREGGVAFGVKPESVRAITAAVKPHCGNVPLMVKLTPNTASIAECAIAAQEGGADALSLINTLTGLAIDIHARKPILANVTGGLSGPAVRPVALRMVWEAAKAVTIPIMGMGGIMTGEDIVAFLLAGATAVQVGTALLVDPTSPLRMLEELQQYGQRHGIEDINTIIGGLQC